jgi:hypothetical protein
MLRAGVNVALGTDGACSNNTLDLITEMQYASMLSKIQSLEARALDCRSVLRLATLNGAKALQVGDKLGKKTKTLTKHRNLCPIFYHLKLRLGYSRVLTPILSCPFFRLY